MVVPTAFPANNLWFQMTPISITHLFTNLWYQIEGNHLPIWVKSNGVGLDSSSDWKPTNQQLVAATVRRPRGGRCGMYFIPRAQVQEYHTHRAADCSLLLLYNLYISLHCFKLSIPRNRPGNEIWLQNPHWSSPFLRAFLQPWTNLGLGKPPSGEVQAGGTGCRRARRFLGSDVFVQKWRDFLWIHYGFASLLLANHIWMGIMRY